MKKTLVVAKKEFADYFYNPIGYVFLAIMLVLAGWMFWGDVFVAGNSDIKPLLQILSYLFSVFIPAISMGLIAEEKKSGTWEVLTTNPISLSNIIWGKLLAGVGFLGVCLLMTLPTLLSLMWLGQMDLGVVISSYFGLLLLGTTFLSIGLLVSGITKHSSAAFIITTIILVLNSLMSQDIVLSKLPPFLVSIFEQLSLPDKMSGFYNGEIGMQAILYLLSVTVVITILAIRANEKNS